MLVAANRALVVVVPAAGAAGWLRVTVTSGMSVSRYSALGSLPEVPLIIRHLGRHLTSPELSTSGLSAFRFFLCSSPPALFFFFSLPLVSGQGLGRNAHHPLRTLFYFVLLSPPTYPGPPLSQLASAAASLNLPSSSWAAYASSTGS